MIQELPKLDDYYQPIPFPEYENLTTRRMDSNRRWKAVSESYGDLKSRTLIDFGCAEGFFLFKFVQDGGRYAVGVEVNKKQVDFTNQLADIKGLNVFSTQEMPKSRFDIAIYFDLYGHSPDLPTIKEFYDMSETLYVSPSGNGQERLFALLDDLKIYETVTPIGAFYENRMIYRCSK